MCSSGAARASRLACRGAAAWTIGLASALVLSTASSVASADTPREMAAQMRSWAATSRAVTAAWVRHEMPTGYVRRALGAAKKEVGRTANDLSRRHPSDGDPGDKLLRRVKALAAQIDHAREAVARDARASAVPVLDALTASAAALRDSD